MQQAILAWLAMSLSERVFCHNSAIRRFAGRSFAGFAGSESIDAEQSAIIMQLAPWLRGLPQLKRCPEDTLNPFYQ